MLKDQLVLKALNWVGQYFHPGIPAQCAAFVSTVIDCVGEPEITGATPYVHTEWAPNFEQYGEKVAYGDLKSGDIILFHDTYESGNSTHIGIYVGDGNFVHRPTMDRTVEKASLWSDYWKSHFQEGRRLYAVTSGVPTPSTETDGPGNAGAAVKLEWHDGVLGVTISGKTSVFKTPNVGSGHNYLYQSGTVPPNPPSANSKTTTKGTDK